jgi:hypothetical protein
MKNSKLVRLLGTFSKSEMNEFEKVVISPFFNRGRNYLPLFKQLKKFHPHFDDDKMTYEYIFGKMYPGKKFSKQIIWNMTSALYNMAEEYLTFAWMKQNKFISAQQIAWGLHDRKLPQLFHKKIDELKDIISHHKLDPPYLQQRIELETLIREYFFLEDKQRYISGHIIKSGEFAILYFLWTITGVLNDLNVVSVTYNAQFKVNIPLELIRNLQLEKLIDYCRENKYSYTWLLEMYYNQIKMLTESNGREYFYRLKGLFEEYYYEFTDSEKTNWIICLINFCANTSDQELKRTLFEIHKFEIKEGIAMYGKYFLKNHFLQIIRNSLAIGEINWTKQFIHDYIPKLNPASQRHVRALSEAYLNFNMKDFSKVLDNLNKAVFRETNDRLTVKIIYLKTYFELGETEVVLLHLDSAFHFLRNNSDDLQVISALKYNRFLNSLKKLVSAGERNDIYRLTELEKALQTDSNLIEKEWLIEKISELKTKEAH